MDSISILIKDDRGGSHPQPQDLRWEEIMLVEYQMGGSGGSWGVRKKDWILPKEKLLTVEKDISWAQQY